MLKNRLQNSISPEIEQMVQAMVKDDVRFMVNEMRTVHREQLVVPVRLIFKNGDQKHTFSRNVSPIGMCLIGIDCLEENQVVDLEIYRLNGGPATVAAEIRWCKPFGPHCYMSGWKFVQLRRS